MSWEEYKEQMRNEWEFYKRNPEFPIVLVLFFASVIYSVCSCQ